LNIKIFIAFFLILQTAGFDFPAAEQSALPESKFPAVLTDVFGNTIKVKDLVQEKTVVVVTLKATWCQICQEQLRRIKATLSESKNCNVTYLVLSPGPTKDLQEIKKQTDFPFPFIEDKGLIIAASLGLKMAPEQIFPSIFILNKKLKVAWLQKGRNGLFYGDPELLKKLNCAGWI